ncbi:MAG: Copper binding protein plastocyanin/azurin family [Thermoplasmata archaeon]|nr:Copper binding protein plastocyanin/azurin family [Thermoplasmata archaeon]
MRRWLIVSLCVLAGLLMVYAAYALFVSYDNGTHVRATIHAGQYLDGPKKGQMYYHCSDVSGGAVKDDGDQCSLTVHKRDKVTLTIISDDGGDRTHDFRLQGWQYFLYPAGAEMELHSGSQSATFTAWATGDYPFICELAGHKDAGMRGTLHVIA